MMENSSPETPHVLILLYGAGSGMGKSTLARAIAEHLLLRNIRTRFVEEHEVLEIPEFQDYVRQVEQGNGDDSDTLANCCAAYIRYLETRLPEIAVMDSFFPCWDWLLSADCSTKKVLRFTDFLSLQLKKLNPILIIVEGDNELALSRAIATRGKAWALDLAEKRTGVRQVSALVNYQLRLREAMETCLGSWPHKVIRINTTNQDSEQSLLKAIEAICFRK
jgi:DNA polymerase III delta prime subunit